MCARLAACELSPHAQGSPWGLCCMLAELRTPEPEIWEQSRGLPGSSSPGPRGSRATGSLCPSSRPAVAEAPSEARQRSWLARSAGRVIHPAGESCLTAAEAEWEGSQLGSLFNWRAPEHECESDFDGVTGAVTSIMPVAVMWSYTLPNFLPQVLSERNKERSGRTESPAAALPQLGTGVKGPQQGSARQQRLPSPLALALPGCPAPVAAVGRRKMQLFQACWGTEMPAKSKRLLS